MSNVCAAIVRKLKRERCTCAEDRESLRNQIVSLQRRVVTLEASQEFTERNIDATFGELLTTFRTIAAEEGRPAPLRLVESREPYSPWLEEIIRQADAYNKGDATALDAGAAFDLQPFAGAPKKA